MPLLVCSNCGSDKWRSERRSVDDRWLLAICKCSVRLVPLISDRAFQARRKAIKSAEPIDLFGALSEGEQRALTRAVKLR